MRIEIGTPIVKINDKAIRKALNKALFATATAMQERTVAQETMPYWTGATQQTTTVTKPRNGESRIQAHTPYSRRIYYGIANSQRYNRNAGPRWWEEYINGTKNDFIRQVFEDNLEL